MEDGGDEVYENALRALFREDETVGKKSVAWLHIFDRMEHRLDSCDKAAGVARNVVLKSSQGNESHSCQPIRYRDWDIAQVICIYKRAFSRR